MGERVKKVNETIKSFEEEKKNIANKYNEKSITDEIKKVDENLKNVNSTLKIKKLHIERLEDELKAISPKQKDLIEEYKKVIEEAKRDPEFLKIASELNDYIDKKEELSKKLLKNKKDNEKLIKKETREAEDKLRANLTQEGMRIDKDITETKLKMDSVLVELDNLKLKYEEKDGVEIPVNGDKRRNLYQKYYELNDALKDLKEAKKMCESKLKEFKDRDDKKAEEFSKILNETRNTQNSEKTSAPEGEQQKTEQQKTQPSQSQTQPSQSQTQSSQSQTQSSQPQPQSSQSQTQPSQSQTQPSQSQPQSSQSQPQSSQQQTQPSQSQTQSSQPQPQSSQSQSQEDERVVFNDGAKSSKIKKIVIDAANNVAYGYSKINGEENVHVIKKNIGELATPENQKKGFYNKIMKKIGIKSPIKRALLGRKINPIIIDLLESGHNEDLINEYIVALRDKTDFPFDYTINLKNSSFKGKPLKFMNRIALEEAKIDTNDVIGAEERFTKIKNLFNKIGKKLFNKKEKVEELASGENENEKGNNGFKDQYKVPDSKIKNIDQQRTAAENRYNALNDEEKEELRGLDSTSEIQKNFNLEYDEAYYLWEYKNKNLQASNANQQQTQSSDKGDR